MTTRSIVGKFCNCLIAIATLLFAFSLTEASEPNGLIVYKEHPDAPPLLTYAIEFSRMETFGQVINVVPVSETQTRRFMKKNVVAAIPYFNLRTSRIVSEEDIQFLVDETSSLERIVQKFPTTGGVIQPRIEELSRAVSAFEQGLALVGGNWVRRDSLGKMVIQKEDSEGADVSNGEITLLGKRYSSPQIKGISGDIVSLQHSGGVASISLSELSQEEIDRLESLSGNSIIAQIANPKSREGGVTQSVSRSENALPASSAMEESKPPEIGPYSVVIEADNLIKKILQKHPREASSDWIPLTSEESEALKFLQESATALGSADLSKNEIDQAGAILLAFSKSSEAARLWREKSGVESVKVFSSIDFPPAKSEENQFSQGWEVLMELHDDLAERETIYFERLQKIEKLLQEDPIKVSLVEEAISEAIEDFPNAELEKDRDELKKNSLGL